MATKVKKLVISFLHIIFRLKCISIDSKKLLIGTAIALIATTSQAATTTDVVCSYAPSQSAIVNRITSCVGGAGVGAEAILQAAGLTAVHHSSGAYIFTGAGGYVAGTFGTAIVAPVLIVTSVVVAGTAVALELSCAPVNHPDSVNKVKEITAEFTRAVSSINDKAVIIRDASGKKINAINNHAINVREEAMKAASDKSIEFMDSAARLYAKGFR